MTNPTLNRLRRVRWAIRLTLTLGVAASVAANILHADHNPISQSISAWPPLALLLTVELVSRVPVHRRSLMVVRVLATTVIASIAAWVSYWHMQGVATRYGETGTSPYLLPISVDGLIVVASICLVELSARLRLLEEPAPATERVAQLVNPTPAPAPVAVPSPVVREDQVLNVDQPQHEPATRPTPARIEPAAPATPAGQPNGGRRSGSVAIGEFRR